MSLNLHDRDMGRGAVLCALLLALVPLSLAAPHTHSTLTVVLDFKGPHTGSSVAEMQKEAGQIIRVSGIRLDWRTRSEAAAAEFPDLVVMTFKGSCVLTPLPIVYDELGPYALTRETDGEVQPFGEVNCNRVVSSLHAALYSGMFGADFRKPDLLMGRALGRIVVHELVHMLTRSSEHAREGVAKAALSAKQLIGASLPLSEWDIERLRQERKVR